MVDYFLNEAFKKKLNTDLPLDSWNRLLTLSSGDWNKMDAVELYCPSLQ